MADLREKIAAAGSLDAGETRDAFLEVLDRIEALEGKSAPATSVQTAPVQFPAATPAE